MEIHWNPGNAPTWGRLSGNLPQTDASIVILVDDSPERIATFFDSEAASLGEPVEAHLIRIPANPGPDSAMIRLRDSLSSMFPDIGHEFSRLPVRKWISRIEKSKESGIASIKDRWILIDQFHHILDAPQTERRTFVDFLRRFAATPTCGVIGGITTQKALPIAKLLGLIDEQDSPESPKPGSAAPRSALLWAAAASLVIGISAAAFAIQSRIQDRRNNNPAIIFEAPSPRSSGNLADASGRNPSTVSHPLQFSDEPLNPAVIQGIDPAGHAVTKPGEDLPAPEIRNEFDPSQYHHEWEFRPGDEMPEADVIYFIAEAYCFGHGVDQNLDRGLSMLEVAFSKGSDKAANLLGTCHARGFGVPQDFEKAHSLYETAIGRGNIHAHGNLGVLFLRGLGCDAQTDRALESFITGARKGDPVAAFYAARCFENGLSSPTGEADRDRAVFFYLEAAKGGHKEAVAWCEERDLLPAAQSPATR